VYKLSKPLYGFKQAPQTWYKLSKTFLVHHGYVVGSIDKTLFTLNHCNNFLLVQIYVDDIIFGGSSHVLMSYFQEMMEKEFRTSMMGQLTFFLGIQVKQTKQGTFVHQAKYMNVLMKTFNMAKLKLSTWMSWYRSMIDSLYHTVIQADIQFALRLCARFQASPHSSYRTAFQWIFNYLKYTLEFGIWYFASSSCELVDFSDADFVGCRIDRKSTTGTCHFLGSSHVFWTTLKQSFVAQSTTKSEYCNTLFLHG
jgi:hypothetical protein